MHSRLVYADHFFFILLNPKEAKVMSLTLQASNAVFSIDFTDMNQQHAYNNIILHYESALPNHTTSIPHMQIKAPDGLSF